jgi:outer membrane receptor for ferrienterochelin and colicins
MVFADESAPGYGMWNISTRHTFNGLKNFTLEPGLGVNNIFDKVDNRPYGVNYASLSPGRTFYASLLIRFNK